MSVRAPLALLVLVFALGCGGKDSPTAPTPPVQTPAPTPTPTPSTIAMDGTITETIPTTTKRVGGARIQIVDGASAGTSTTADGNGYYLFPSLTAGTFRVEYSATGYETSTVTLTRTTSGSQNHALRPVPRIFTTTHNDSVNAGSPRCPDFYSTTSGPCVQYEVPAHSNGRLSAVLTWTGGTNRLVLVLLRAPRTNPEDRMAVSRFSSPFGREEITADLAANFMYYIHVVYDSGATVQPYTLVLSRPN